MSSGKGKAREKKRKKRTRSVYKQSVYEDKIVNGDHIKKRLAAEATRQEKNIQAPDLIDTITQISQKVDLVKVRKQLTELNDIFKQINEVVTTFQRKGSWTQQQLPSHPHYPPYHSYQRVNLPRHLQHQPFHYHDK